jgi:hypothetical protein
MSNFKGTKGKWRAVNNGPHWNNKAIDNWVIEWSEDGELVSDHVYDPYDALLISKAPEMLEMLEELYNDSEAWSGIFPSQQLKIERLIKEATEL